MSLIYSIPLPLLFLLVLAPCLLLGVAGVHLTRRRDWMLSPDDNDIIAVAHAFAGVLYAVALGLMVVNVQADYTEVEMVVMKEASLAEDLYIDSVGLSGSGGDEIQVLAKDYVNKVIEEWPKISRETVSELKSHKAVDQLAHRIIELEPVSDKELVVYGEVLGGLNEMLDLRRERLHLGVDGVGFVTWTVVVMGAIITIGMTWFYNTRSARAHYGFVAMMSLMFGLMIFLIIAMDHPLLGQFSVDSGPFEEARSDIEFWENEFRD